MSNNGNDHRSSDDPVREEEMQENDDSDEGEPLEVIDLDEVLGDPEDWIEEGDDGEEPIEDVEEPELGVSFPDIPIVTAKVTFPGHQGSVFCLAVDDAQLTSVVSGGEDDKAFVWDIENGNICFVCEGHKDSVVQVGVSYDAHYVFSSDMSGVVKVWNFKTGEEIWSTEISETKWVRWHPKAHVLVAATDDGSLYMWQLPQGQCKVHQASGAVSCAEFFPDGKRLAFSHGTGTVSVLDLKEWKVLQNFTGRRGNQEEVLCLDVDSQGALMASGSMNGTIRVYQSQTGKVIKDIDDPAFLECAEDDRAIECVAFSRNHPWLAVAGLNGVICLYDIPTQTKRHTCSHEALKGITKLVWVANTDLLMAGHLNGVLSLWDSKSGELQKVFKCQDEVLDLIVSRNGSRAVAACDNGDVFVYEI